MATGICEEFLDHSNRKLTLMLEHMDACLGKLSEDQVWEKHGPHENAVANLVLHLCGNVQQWIMHGIAGMPDVRVREAEFSVGGGMNREELRTLFHSTLEAACEVIADVPCSRLTEIIHPQNNSITVLEAIYQVVGHVQQHVGQVIVLTKQMIGQDLDLVMPRPR